MTALDEPRGKPVSRALLRILARMDALTGTVHHLRGDGLLHLVAHAGPIPESLMPAIRRIPVGKGMAGLAAERGEPVQICNLQTDTGGDSRPAARSTGMRGSICVPIKRNHDVVAVVGVAVPHEREFSRDEAAWLLKAGKALLQDFR